MKKDNLALDLLTNQEIDQEPILITTDINVITNDNTPILKDINLTLTAGKILAVLGKSGSGKTILAKTLANWLPENLNIKSGNINVIDDNGNLTSFISIKQYCGKYIGYIGGDLGNGMDPTLPVGKQLVEKLHSIDPAISHEDAKQSVLKLMTDVRIPSAEIRFHEYPYQFSGGMMQRIMIVDALVTKPKILIADNITQPLDVTIGAQILRLIKKVAQEYQTAILYCTGSPSIARDIADEILVLHEGKVVEIGDTQEVLTHPISKVTQEILKDQPTIWSDDIKLRDRQQQLIPVLKIEDIVKTYHHRGNNIHAVRNTTFDIYGGENFAIVGESGCGKSTLTRLLTWLEKPDEGDITLINTSFSQLNAKELRSLRQQFQLLLQDPFNSLPTRMTIGRMIAEGLLIHKKSQKDIKQQVLKIMADVGLSAHLYDELVFELNGAERQRIAIARALILQPKIIILDETFSSLDPSEQQKMLSLFSELQEKYQLTYIFISHDLALVRKSCDRIAVMYLGEMVEISDNQSIFENPAHPYTKALLSAVSTLEDNPFDIKKCLLDGEPPSPINIPRGCAFKARCPNAMPICGEEKPALLIREDSKNFVACHLVR